MLKMSEDIILGDYRIILKEKLGHGSFGVVYKGRDKISYKPIAAKQCEITSEKNGRIAVQELKNFQQLQKHPHIVSLLDFHYKNNSFWLIMEFCDAGDLDNYFVTYKPCFDDQKDIMFQCASALHFMHSRTKPVVHRDIKPGNILMKKTIAGAIVKIADFGLAKMVQNDPARTLVFFTRCGTQGFMAPEFFTGTNEYRRAVDVFALGLVFLSILNHKEGNTKLQPQCGGDDGMVGIGQDIAFKQKHSLPLKDYVAEVHEHSQHYKVLKNLIKQMIHHTPDCRINISLVENILRSIGGKSSERLPNPLQREDDIVRVDAAMPDLVPDQENDKAMTKDQPVGDATESPIVPDALKMNAGDVGFVMVKRALEERLREKDDAGERREKASTSNSVFDMLGDVFSSGNRLRVGEKVQLMADKRKVQELQEGYGGWRGGMERYLGQFGVVTKVRKNVAVSFEGGDWYPFNPKVLIRTGERLFQSDELDMFKDHEQEAVKKMFKKYDVVTIRSGDEAVIQSVQRTSSGGWNPLMKEVFGQRGMVNYVKTATGVNVMFLNKQRWALHPDILEKVDMSGETIESGDMVVTVNDRAVIQMYKHMFENWDDQQFNYLDNGGLVRAVISSKQVVVDTGSRTFIWHPLLLRLWAKGEDVMAALIRRR